MSLMGIQTTRFLPLLGTNTTQILATKGIANNGAHIQKFLPQQGVNTPPQRIGSHVHLGRQRVNPIPESGNTFKTKALFLSLLGGGAAYGVWANRDVFLESKTSELADRDLVDMWSVIQKQINFRETYVPQTASEIRAWLNDLRNRLMIVSVTSANFSAQGLM